MSIFKLLRPEGAAPLVPKDSLKAFGSKMSCTPIFILSVFLLTA